MQFGSVNINGKWFAVVWSEIVFFIKTLVLKSHSRETNTSVYYCQIVTIHQCWLCWWGQQCSLCCNVFIFLALIFLCGNFSWDGRPAGARETASSAGDASSAGVCSVLVLRLVNVVLAPCVLLAIHSLMCFLHSHTVSIALYSSLQCFLHSPW